MYHSSSLLNSLSHKENPMVSVENSSFPRIEVYPFLSQREEVDLLVMIMRWRCLLEEEEMRKSSKRRT